MKCLAVFLVLIGLSLAMPVEKQNAEADLNELLSILNSQTTDTDQAKAEQDVTIRGLTSLIPKLIDQVTRNQKQAKKQSLIHPIFPSPFIWPSFPTRKGTANTQEEQATAQLGFLASLAIAIAAALAGAGVSRALDEIPLQELADSQGPKKIAGKVAVGGAMKDLAMDISELDSLLGNHQAIQQDAAKDILVDDLLFAAGDRLGKTLTQEQLKELFQLVQKMAPLIKG